MNYRKSNTPFCPLKRKGKKKEIKPWLRNWNLKLLTKLSARVVCSPSTSLAIGRRGLEMLRNPEIAEQPLCKNLGLSSPIPNNFWEFRAESEGSITCPASKWKKKNHSTKNHKKENPVAKETPKYQNWNMAQPLMSPKGAVGSLLKFSRDFFGWMWGRDY